MENLHGYVFDKTDGHNSPNGIWYKAESGGKKYFLKKFQWPKFPKEGISKDIYNTKKAECDTWLEQKNKLIMALDELGDGAGNIVSPRDIFREGLCFYQVTYWVDASAKTLDEIKKYSEEEKIMLLKTYSSALKKVHGKGIIHGDLKPENIMVGKSGAGNPVAKLIDFDDSYFSKQAFPPERTVSTEAYQSPELAAYKRGHEEYRNILTCANDVFASGIIFHQFWCGEMPEYPGREKGRFLFEAIAAGETYRLNNSLPLWLKELLTCMFNPSPEKRPTMEIVHECISKKNSPLSKTYEPKKTTIGVSKITPVKAKKEITTTSSPVNSILKPVVISDSSVLNIIDRILNGESIPLDLSGYTQSSAKFLKEQISFATKNRGIIPNDVLTKHLTRAMNKLELRTDKESEFSIKPCINLPEGYCKIEIISENKVIAYTTSGSKVTLPRITALALKLVQMK